MEIRYGAGHRQASDVLRIYRDPSGCAVFSNDTAIQIARGLADGGWYAQVRDGQTFVYETGRISPYHPEPPSTPIRRRLIQDTSDLLWEVYSQREKTVDGLTGPTPVDNADDLMTEVFVSLIHWGRIPQPPNFEEYCFEYEEERLMIERVLPSSSLELALVFVNRAAMAETDSQMVEELAEAQRWLARAKKERWLKLQRKLAPHEVIPL